MCKEESGEQKVNRCRNECVFCRKIAERI